MEKRVHFLTRFFLKYFQLLNFFCLTHKRNGRQNFSIFILTINNDVLVPILQYELTAKASSTAETLDSFDLEVRLEILTSGAGEAH